MTLSVQIEKPASHASVFLRARSHRSLNQQSVAK